MRRVRARSALARAATSPARAFPEDKPVRAIQVRAGGLGAAALTLGASYALRHLSAHPFARGRGSLCCVEGPDSGIEPESGPVRCGLDARSAPTTSQKPRRCPARLRAGGHGRELGGAEQRRARGRARSAPRALTRRSCLSVESAANAASSATGHETEQHRARGRARSAPRALTRGMCLSGATKGRAASYAAGHGPEQRRAVGATRRPLPSERPGPPARSLARSELSCLRPN